MVLTLAFDMTLIPFHLKEDKKPNAFGLKGPINRIKYRRDSQAWQAKICTG